MNQTRTQQDHLQMLRDQLSNLKDCASLYDRGREAQALPMAGILRNLFHSSNRVTSVIRHLGAENTIRLWSIAGGRKKTTVQEVRSAREAGSGITLTFGLMMGLDGPTVDLSVKRGLTEFGFWWAEELIFSDGMIELGRHDVVLLLANKDGGSHVDDEIPPELVSLRDGIGTFTIRKDDGTESVTELTNQHWRIVRQIAEEVIQSIHLKRLAGER